MVQPDPQLSRARRVLALKIVAVLAVLGMGALFMLRGLDVKALYNQGVDLIRSFGPVAFFGAMAVLPAMGCPLTVFTISVGPIFGGQLGLPLVLLISAGAISFNLAFGYWLARYALRPWVEWIFRWLGYRLPQISAEDRLALSVLVRVTPGPPYCLQNFILGMTGVPFGLYMVVSMLITIPLSFGFILFGDSLAQGKGKVVVLSLLLLVALSFGIKFLRGHFARRSAISK